MPKKPHKPHKAVRETAIAPLETLEVKAGVFKDTCLQLLDDVRDKHIEIVVTKHGKPVARVVPIEGTVQSARGFMRGTVLEHGDIVSPDFEAWGEYA